MIRIGLTGSIAMGKSATADIFRSFGVPVHDADATVHKLMTPNGLAFEKISSLFPDVIMNGTIDRQKLGKIVFQDDQALKKLEAILHPLVQLEERKFIQTCYRRRLKICVMDIPLLFETNGQKRMDHVCVVSCLKSQQKRRALKRSGMNNDKLKAILKKQMPDLEKRKRADHIIFTGAGYRSARNQVKKILIDLKE